jgi:hypothetical protein
MACGGITDIVTRETGRFMPGEIFRRVYGSSIWMSLVQRGVFPAGLSQTINTLTYERNAPTDAEPVWTDVTAIDSQEGGACLPTPDLIDIGSTVRSFNLKRRALHGPKFCAEEFRSVFDLKLQLDAISAIIADRVRIEWEIRDRHEYFKNCQTKVVVNDCYNPTEDTTTATAYPSSGGCPTQTVGLSLLDKYRIQLLRDGAANSALLQANGRPLMTVVASPEWIGNTIRLNSDIRQDVRWADSGQGNNARLLKAFGINHEYDGFMFLGDLFPRRFTCANGVFTEVPAYLQNQATKGNKYDINPAYRTAPYEELFIFDPEVFVQLVPQPITNPAPNFRFSPISYVGDIKILNIPNEICNPDENILRHRIIMAAGSMPKYVWRGVSFVQKRCDPACNSSTSCTS